MLSAICLWRAEWGNAYTAYTYRQYFSVDSDGWWEACIRNFDTNSWSCLPYVYGSGSFWHQYDTYGTIYGYILYDWGSSRFTETYLELKQH